MEERVITEARRAIEAVVMAAVEPVEPQVLAQLVEIPVSEVETLCAELAEEYEREARGFALVRVAGGYRYQTHEELAPYVEAAFQRKKTMAPLERDAIPSFPAYGLTAPPVDLASLPEANRQRALVMRKMREISEASGNG